MKPRLLITGAAGRLGTELASRLREGWDLTLLDRVAPLSGREGDRIIVGELGDGSVLAQAVSGASAVLHLACRHGEAATFADTLDTNYIATLALYEAAIAAGATDIVFASSNHGWGFYPRSAAPLPGNAPPRPDSWYGISKIWSEAVLAFLADSRGVRTTSLRIGFCGPAVPDERCTHMWIGFDDLAQLTRLALARRDAGHRAFFATGDCVEPFFDNSGAKALGFVTTQRAEHNLARPGIAGEGKAPGIAGEAFGGSYAAVNSQCAGSSRP
ncbi:NAD(P)-dependent oxidoreductase (plasmid) [Bosea sp. F3-2]|uniref:NAD-dependent epimerase/dehydratase family protein n=1 Tax=Bosea sp. F3-2 TaxID=2599640 RepID=UPI0011EF0D09|nr:NAD(P)-dependent oxidoreductase [Bosea sp. F3-2]QEL27299.1 NAD(P)-dependent oxidoreductase [Bosea sp. F3-2]